MEWDVRFDPAFAADARAFARAVNSKSPHCDTLKGSKYANMKELRFTLPDGEWRVAFAFDPERCAILLVGGSKSGVSEKQFYKDLIRVADARFTAPSKDGGEK
jgi:hypothetical protein